MITSYFFGKMVINNKTFTSDLMIFPDGKVQDNWQRQSGHLLVPQDLTALRAARPGLIIAGTGAHNRMSLGPGLSQALKAENIEIRAMDTAAAVDLYNRLCHDRTGPALGACFHLTC